MPKTILTIIIPTLNEEKALPKLLTSLLIEEQANVEVIVCDGGSTDSTKSVANNFNLLFLSNSNSSRAIQMNAGAAAAKGNYLLFLHADVIAPKEYLAEINSILKHKDFGCFSYDFDSNRFLLKVMAWLNQFKDPFVCGGDQGLFITKKKFNELGGFHKDCCIMEDFDLKKRAIKKGMNYSVSQKRFLVSPRKYEYNSFARVWVANIIAFSLFTFGVSFQKIKNSYQFFIRVK